MDPKENFPEQAVDLEREQPVNPVRDSGVVDEEAAAGDEKNEKETTTTKGEALEIDGGGGADAAGLNQNSKLQEVAEGGKKKNKKEGEEEEGGAGGSVSIFKLFAYADSFDYLLLLVGTVGAVVHGAALPVFFVIFSKLLNGFGSNINSPDQTNVVVGKVGNPPSSSSSSEQKKKNLLKLLLLLVFCCGICFTFAIHFVFDHLHLSLLDTWPRVMFMLLGFSGICLIAVSFVMLKVMMMMILGFFNFANTEEVRFTSCHLFFLSQINFILW
jgi:hypothetical protein